MDSMHQGLLWKRGKSPKSWRKWLFTIQQNQLVYFKPSKSLDIALATPSGTISINKCRVGAIVYDTEHPHCMVLQTSDRVYFLAAATQEERQKWVKELLGLKKLSITSFTPATELIRSSIEASSDLPSNVPATKAEFRRNVPKSSTSKRIAATEAKPRPNTMENGRSLPMSNSMPQLPIHTPDSPAPSAPPAGRGRKISIILKSTTSAPSLNLKGVSEPRAGPEAALSPRSAALAKAPAVAPVSTSTSSYRTRPRVSVVSGAPAPPQPLKPNTPLPALPAQVPLNVYRGRARSRSQPDPVAPDLLATLPPPLNSPRDSIDDEDVDLDEVDDVREFLADIGIEVPEGDSKLTLRAAILLRQLEGSGTDLNQVRQSLMLRSMSGDPMPMDFDQLEAIIAEEIGSKDAHLATDHRESS